MKLKGIVRGQTYAQPSSKVLWKRIAMVVEEKRVVAERWHRDADLRQVVQILEHRDFSQQQAVRNILRHHVTAHEMLNGTGFAAVRPQDERIQALLTASSISRSKYRAVIHQNGKNYISSEFD